MGGGAGVAGGTGAAGGVSGGGGTVQNKRSGYEGLVFRPLLYDTRVVGLHDVLAPLNSQKPGYPEDTDRDFGPWGLSFASDRWDLRRALVLEMRAKQPSGELNARQLLYVDLQTLQPLYLATYDAKDELTNIGVYAGRWSEDRPDYPRILDQRRDAARRSEPQAAGLGVPADQGPVRSRAAIPQGSSPCSGMPGDRVQTQRTESPEAPSVAHPLTPVARLAGLLRSLAIRPPAGAVLGPSPGTRPRSGSAPSPGPGPCV